MNRGGIVLLLAISGVMPAAGGVIEEVVQIPIAVTDMHSRFHRHTVTVTVFRESDRIKSPFLVLSHGRANAEGQSRLGRVRYAENSRYFVSKGFAVFVPTRVGYGVTGGADVENSGPCSRREFYPALEAGAAQVLETIRHAQSQPYVDGSRGVLVGQSVGGAITIALAAKSVRGVVAAINFAGGAGGNPGSKPEDPCSEPALRSVFAAYGETSRMPTLWLYSENDRYWGRGKPRAWFDAFRAGGGAGEFVQLPAHGSDGHGSFTRDPNAWRPAVERFLMSVGFEH